MPTASIVTKKVLWAKHKNGTIDSLLDNRWP